MLGQLCLSATSSELRDSTIQTVLHTVPFRVLLAPVSDIAGRICNIIANE